MDKKKNIYNSTSTQEIADLYCATYYLREFIEMLNLYPTLTERAEVMKIHRILVDTIDLSLKLDLFQRYKENYIKPEFNTKHIPEYLSTIIMGALLCLYPRITDNSVDLSSLPEDKWEKEFQKIRKQAFNNTSVSLRTVLETLEKIMVFDCKLPHPVDSSEFNSKSRTIYILTEYWKIYSEYVQYLSTTNAWFKPDPMIIFMTNIKERIISCIEKLGCIDKLQDVYDFLDMPLTEVDAIPEYIAERIDTAWNAIEIIRSEIGFGIHSLTNQEKLFMEAYNTNFQTNRASAEKWFHKLLKKVEQRNNSTSQFHSTTQLSCTDYIRKVELKLRSIIMKKYLETFNENWLDELKKAIGPDAYNNAHETMQQRHVNKKDEIIYYTNMPDLQQAIINNWDIFSNIISCKRRDFNRLMSPILKGRTEEAHNRPIHLWPEIEQDRVRVACHDLLGKITADL